MKEPTVILGAIAEVIKAIIPTLIIFGIIHWTSDQVAQVMLLTSVIVGSLTVVLTRSQVTPTPKVDELIKTAVAQPVGTSVETVKEIQEVKEAKGIL